MRVNQLQQLIERRIRLAPIALPYRLRDAVPQMIPHQRLPDGPQRFLHRRKLHQNVGAVAVIVHHSLQPANLPFDSPQPVPISRFDFTVHASRFFRPGMRFAAACRGLKSLRVCHIKYPLGVYCSLRIPIVKPALQRRSSSAGQFRLRQLRLLIYSPAFQAFAGKRQQNRVFERERNTNGFVRYQAILNVGSSLVELDPLVAWLAIGLIIYFSYGRKHSNVQSASAPRSGVRA